MSLVFNFYVEIRQEGAWTVPEPHLSYDCGYPRVESFLLIDWNVGVPWGFFFSREPVFPVRMGYPEWTGPEPLCRFFSDHSVLEPPERARWLPFEELLVDAWEESWIHVRETVPAALATLFGDGDQPFPQSALAAAGWDEHRIARLRQGAPTRGPIDRYGGRGRHKVETSHPETPLDVTWRDTIAGCMTARRTAAFRDLRQFGRDEDLRVVAMHF